MLIDGQLSVLLLTFATISASPEVPNDEFLKRAAAQLDRLSQYKNVKLETNDLLEPIPRHESSRIRNRNEEKKGDTLQRNSASEQEILLNEDAMRRIDELATNAYKLYNDPNYETIMRERIKRSGSGDFISGIAGKVLSGVTGLSGGSSGGGQAYDSYGAPVQPYERPFTIWDFKKAILNTVIQAVKAIAGGAIAFKGHLIKGGGFIVQTGGRVISSAGEAAASLGSQLASSALIAQSQPAAYSPPAGYSYDPPQNHDYSYDGPPPSHDSYQPDGYNNGQYNAANDGPADEPGLLVIKPTKATQPQLHQEDPRNNFNNYHPENMQPLPLEEPSKTAQLTKLIGLVTGTSGPIIHHNNNHNDDNNNNNNYGPEHKDQDQPTANTNVVNHPPNYQNDQSSRPSQIYGNPGYSAELATQQIQSLLNPYLNVPINAPTTFKEQSYNYAMPLDSNVYKIPIFGQNNNNNNDINIDAVSMSVGATGYANPNFEIVPSVQIADWSRSLLLPGSNARGHKKYNTRRHVYGNNDNRYSNINKLSHKRSKIYFMF
ncbi:Protein of unknown function [Cotesia congregata]|uniref:Uncharacterized protein n=1 Tax=Cotesia congregata TaxID=51543 RepID=A0A8J2MIG3_COTCN|nr:Protein of unknown function [Cotesia congregata]